MNADHSRDTQDYLSATSDVPVAYNADVVVVGAGPAGFSAALKAARMGKDVLVVERFDMPGGVHTSGLQGTAGAGVGGIHTELMERLHHSGHIHEASETTHPDWAGNPLTHYERLKQPGSAFQRLTFNPEGAGCAMVNMLEEAGARALYATSFVDCVVKDGTIQAIIVENASGRQAVTGRLFVEASGTGQVAAMAGVPCRRGGGPQPASAEWDGVERPVPGGLLWTLGDVSFEALVRHQTHAKDPLLQKTIAEARAAGDLPEGVYRPRMGGENVYGAMYIGHPTLDMSPLSGTTRNGGYVLWQNAPYELALHMDDDGEDHSKAIKLLRAHIDAEWQFLRKYVPGFENSTITNVGRLIGVRDGRHPEGEHVLTFEDIREGRSFRDAVTRPITKTLFWEGVRQLSYEVPYRSFLPKGVSNLILTGASMSFTYETIFMAMRNFAWCMQTGEIAGFAAARALEKRVGLRDLEWTEPYEF